MSIQETKDGRWRVQVDVGLTIRGKRDRRTKVCATLKEAKKAELAYLMEKERNAGTSGRITLERFVRDDWLPEKERDCTHDTVRMYRSVMKNHILPVLGKYEITDIKKLHIQRMISACNTYKVARNAHEVLRAALTAAVDLDIVQKNVARTRVSYPARIEKVGDDVRVGEWLTSFEEHRRVIEAARGTDAFALVVLGLCFGLRKGEVLGMDWEQIDFRKREIHVVQTYVRGDGIKPPKTRGSVRTIPMTAYAESLLREIRDDGGITRVKGAVCTCRGHRMPPERATRRIRAFTRSADVPHITMMTLRHSFATACIRDGINVASVSKWLGHSTITTTLNKYVKPLQQDLRADVAEAVDAAYLRAAGE